MNRKKYDPDIYHRRSIRLRGYDYSACGAYFVTICTQNRRHLFGEIVNDMMEMNDAGRMVDAVWEEIPIHYPGVQLGEYVVMPNHVHFIVVIVGAGESWGGGGAGTGACPYGGADGAGTGACPYGGGAGEGQARGSARTGAGLSLPDVVHRVKTLSTKRYIDGVRQNGWLPFQKRLWQRNYYECIIRDDDDYNRIARYIIHNPRDWRQDRLYFGETLTK